MSTCGSRSSWTAGRYLHYWRNEPGGSAAVLAKARPVVEARGTPARRQSFYMTLAIQRARQARYRIDEEMLANARTAVLAAEQGVGEHDVAFAVFSLGFLLLWHGDLAEAQEQLEASLAIVERIGDVVLRARCLCYLNVTALRRHDVEAVRSLAPEALAAAETAGYPEYVAAAKATMAWVAWRRTSVPRTWSSLPRGPGAMGYYRCVLFLVLALPLAPIAVHLPPARSPRR